MSWLGRVIGGVFSKKPKTLGGADGINDQRRKYGLPPIPADSAILSPVGTDGHVGPDPATAAVSLDYSRRMAVILQTDPDLYTQVGNGEITLDAAEMVARHRAKVLVPPKPQEPAHPVPPNPESEPGPDCKTKGPGGCGREGCKRKRTEPAPAPQSFTHTFDPYRNPQEGQ